MVSDCKHHNADKGIQRLNAKQKQQQKGLFVLTLASNENIKSRNRVLSAWN